ncbi:aldo-keto reductase family 1 member A1-A-like [Diadema antillarum]|uniref:aldo-keto reductase family 1 member A1-A-like n=1 Tax=Diadema antillarum TaxID=105358 RepID=UPI003A872B19
MSVLVPSQYHFCLSDFWPRGHYTTIILHPSECVYNTRAEVTPTETIVRLSSSHATRTSLLRKVMAAKNISVKLANGRPFPLLGLGTWKSKPDQVRVAVLEAIAAGYRHIDGAAAYNNEEEVGAAIKEKIADGTITREDIFVTTKLWSVDARASDVEEACKTSLKKLGLDYVDLYLMHWPFAFLKGHGGFPIGPDKMMMADNDVDYVDTWKAMETLVDKGYARAIGVSNFNKSQLQRILDLPPKHKVCNLQMEITPYLPGTEMKELCDANGITLTAYSPLGSPDRPLQYDTDPILMQDPVVLEIAKAKGRTPAQIVIRYQLDRGISVIPKSVTPSRIRENFEVLDFQLTADEMKRLNELDRNFRYIVFPAAKSCKFYPY